MGNGKDKLFEVLEDRTELKRVSDREYGHIRFKPDSAIIVHVKKNVVSVAFTTEGKEKSLSVDVPICCKKTGCFLLSGLLQSVQDMQQVILRGLVGTHRQLQLAAGMG